jgi:hypothetical protein
VTPGIASSARIETASAGEGSSGSIARAAVPAKRRKDREVLLGEARAAAQSVGVEDPTTTGRCPPEARRARTCIRPFSTRLGKRVGRPPRSEEPGSPSWHPAPRTTSPSRTVPAFCPIGEHERGLVGSETVRRFLHHVAKELISRDFLVRRLTVIARIRRTSPRRPAGGAGPTELAVTDTTPVTGPSAAREGAGPAGNDGSRDGSSRGGPNSRLRLARRSDTLPPPARDLLRWTPLPDVPKNAWWGVGRPW